MSNEEKQLPDIKEDGSDDNNPSLFSDKQISDDAKSEMLTALSKRQKDRVHDARRKKEGFLSKEFKEARNDAVWYFKNKDYFGYTLCAILIQLIFGWSYAFPDGTTPTCNDEFSFGYSTTNTIMCNTHMVLVEILPKIRVLTSFILAGFVASSVSLWLKRRSAYCALCGATRNIIINISTIVPITDNHEGNEWRENMLRWAVLGYELSVLKARGLMDDEKGREYLKSLRLLKDGEWECMVNGDRHSTVWCWIQSQARGLTEEGIIQSEVAFQTICQAVTLSRDKANDMMSCIDRDQPSPYSLACALLVNVNIIFETLSKGFKWAILLNEARGSLFVLYSQPLMWFDIVGLLFYTMIFAMLYDLCFVLYNPFGPRTLIDIPHSVVGAGIRKLALECCALHLPPGHVLKSKEKNSLTRRKDVAVGFSAEVCDIGQSLQHKSGGIRMLGRSLHPKKRMLETPVLEGAEFTPVEFTSPSADLTTVQE